MGTAFVVTMVSNQDTHLADGRDGLLRAGRKLNWFCLGSEPFGYLAFVADFRLGGAVTVWPALAGYRSLRAPMFEMSQQGLAAWPARGETTRPLPIA